MTTIPDRLKAWRERLGITQATAAARLRVPLRTYQEWEFGRRGGKSTTLHRIMEDYGIDKIPSKKP